MSYLKKKNITYREKKEDRSFTFLKKKNITYREKKEDRSFTWFFFSLLIGGIKLLITIGSASPHIVLNAFVNIILTVWFNNKEFGIWVGLNKISTIVLILLNSIGAITRGKLLPFCINSCRPLLVLGGIFNFLVFLFLIQFLIKITY